MYPPSDPSGLSGCLIEKERNEKERKDLEGSRVEGTFHINLFMLH
jgi:hypothetical protein